MLPIGITEYIALRWLLVARMNKFEVQTQLSSCQAMLVIWPVGPAMVNNIMKEWP
jgi:hypothetical protein